MEYPTAFYQEVYTALVAIGLTSRDLEGFSIQVTETFDSENYRIERHYTHANLINYWEGNNWEDVLAECVEACKSPF